MSATSARYVVKAYFEVHQRDLPEGQYRALSGAWVMDVTGATRPVHLEHIQDARAKADAWNRRASSVVTS